MKTLKLTLLTLLTSLVMISCGGIGSQPATAEGFTEIENEINSKFGDDAYFTDLSIVYNHSTGNAVSATVTGEPSSLKMGQWIFMRNFWKQNSDITLEVPTGTKASDFMFQLNDKINLTKLGELVEKSRKQLTEEKQIENPTLDMAFVKFPKNGDISKAEYSIILEPENGGTDFKFYYNLKGELLKMSY